MTTNYTPILQLALPVTGELNGTWGDVVNDNITSMIEQAIAGMASITTWTGASHTLTTADGTTDEARCAILDLGGSPGGAATVICPARTKLYIVHNNVGGGYAATLRTASGTGISIPSGKTMVLYCDGTNVVEGSNYVATAANAATADKWTTARNLAGNSVDGSANVAFSNKFIVQGTTDSGLSGAQFLGSLATGLVKNTTTTGVLSIATSGTDYAPATSGTSILKGNGSGGFSNATSGTDYAPATSGTSILYGNGSGGFSNVTIGSGVSFAGGTLSATGTGGTVTSVTGTSPIASSGGTTPAISISQASSTTNGYLSSTDWNTFNNKGSGTVTSVTGTSPVASSGGTTPAISLASGYGDTQNPYASKTANYVLAAPNGSAGAPTFRAIVAADIPTLNQNTTGTAAGLSSTLAITSGGTGQTTATAAFDALAPTTTTGDTIYYNGSDNVRLAGNTSATKQFLSQTGNGTVSAAPSWSTVSKSDVGLGNVENTALSTWAGSTNITTLGTIATGTWSATTIGVTKGGTGLTTIAALSIPVANTLNTYTTVTPAAGQSVRINAGGTAWEAYTPSSSTGTVSSVSVVSANGLAGTVANATTTPAITLSTSITGVLKGNGTAISAATAGTDYLAPPSGTAILKANSGGALANAAPNTDYLAPTLFNTAVTGFKTATFNSQTTIATTTGAITVDWTSAQNQKQTEPTGTITYTFTAPPGPCHLQLIIDSDGTSTAQTINWPGTVVWYGATYAGTNNKKAVVNFWYDGSTYHATYMTQV